MRRRVLWVALAGVIAGASVSCGGGGEFAVAVEAAEPASGPLDGGQTVVISGSGFLEGGAAPSLVLVGDSLATGATILSDTELQIVTPPGDTTGAVDVVVFNDHGFATAAGAYTYVEPPTITALEPDVGPLAGGATVTITGTGFDRGGDAPVVFFGDALADPRTTSVVSDTEMTVEAPPSSLFTTVDVRIASDGGEGLAPSAYAYLDPGLVATVPGSFFGGGGPDTLVHLDPLSGAVTRLATLQLAPDRASLGVDSLTYAAGGRFYGGSRDGNLNLIDLRGGNLVIGRLPRGRAPALARHDDQLMAMEKQHQGLDVTLGVLSVADASYERLSTPPPSTAQGPCLASDGATLWALTRSSLGGFELMELDPATGAPIADTLVHLPRIQRCRELTALGDDLYMSGNINPPVPTLFGGGDSAGIWRLEVVEGAEGEHARVARFTASGLAGVQ